MKINWVWRAFLLGPAIIALQSAWAQKKPNIILILADDIGYGDLGCYGQKMIQTPNLDALAANGIRFTDYYSGCTVCAPSRESLLTGMHTGHTFIRGNFLTDEGEDPSLPLDTKTMAECLKKNGYQTALFGKWGLGGEEAGPDQQGFDRSFCYLDQIKAHEYYAPYLYDNGVRVYLEANKNKAKGVYSHDLFVEKTLDYLENVKQDQPFFLYLPYTISHGGYTLPPEEPYLSKDWPQQYKVYATMISKLDKDIGRIQQLLKLKGLTDNTVIFFTSDNGANMGFARFFNSNGQFSGSKFGLYEGGIRTPLIAYWPGKIKPGQVSNHVTAAWDFLPTICELSGISSPSHLDGISFLPALTNKKQTNHPYLYWEYYDYNYNWFKPENKAPRNYLQSIAIRYGNWKGVKNREAAFELYDLMTDPGEKQNLAKEHPDVIKKMESFCTESTIPDPPFFPYASDDKAKLHLFNVNTFKQLQGLFHYTADYIPFVSSHRGGPTKGYPENCIATFANTLRHTWSIMEIDPHYTKDSLIVLMHDPTLDRTSTGHGKVSDYTLAELEKLNLKDVNGDVTKWKIPTLDETLEWARGKTVLIMDMKDVPIEVRVKKIMEHHAEAHTMLMVYSIADAKKCYALNKNIMMEVFIPDRKSADEFDASGVPWSNVVAFVSHNDPKDNGIFSYINEKGALAIQGSSRTIDNQYTNEKISKLQLINGYKRIIHSGADIIEADLGIEAGKALEHLKPAKSSRQKYFLNPK